MIDIRINTNRIRLLKAGMSEIEIGKEYQWQRGFRIVNIEVGFLESLCKGVV